MNTIQALQALYVKLGGSLTDTYANIADGAAVGNYTTIPDMIQACTQKAGSGGGGSVTVDAELDENSENPVQNQAIFAAVQNAATANDYQVTLVPSGSGEYDAYHGEDLIRWSDIYAAKTAGKNVDISIEIDDSTVTAPIAGYGEMSGWFGGTAVFGDTAVPMAIHCNYIASEEKDGWTLYPDPSDNG